MPEISRVLNVPVGTVKAWKKSSVPDHWERYKSDIIQASTEKLKKKQIDSIAAFKLRQQKWLKTLGDCSVQSIRMKAANNSLDAETAKEVFDLVIREERKLYLPIKEAVGAGQSSRSLGIGIKTGEGRTDILAAFNETFEARRGKLPGSTEPGSGEESD